MQHKRYIVFTVIFGEEMNIFGETDDADESDSLFGRAIKSINGEFGTAGIACSDSELKEAELSYVRKDLRKFS